MNICVNKTENFSRTCFRKEKFYEKEDSNEKLMKIIIDLQMVKLSVLKTYVDLSKGNP